MEFFKDFFAICSLNFIIICYSYKPNINCNSFTAAPSIPNLVCKLYAFYYTYPRNLLEVSETLFLPYIAHILMLCAFYRNKIRNTFVLLPILKFQAWSVSYVHLTGFGIFESLYTTYRSDFVIKYKFYTLNTKYIWFIAHP